MDKQEGPVKPAVEGRAVGLEDKDLAVKVIPIPGGHRCMMIKVSIKLAKVL